MKTQWIVCADASRAKLISRIGNVSREVEAFAHPESRLDVRDIVSAPAGRQSGGGGRKHGLAPRTDRKETEAVDFARQIAHRLETARADGGFDELILVAPPHFLGILRKQLDRPTSACVVQVLDKDLVQAGLAQVEESLERAR